MEQRITELEQQLAEKEKKIAVLEFQLSVYKLAFESANDMNSILGDALMDTSEALGKQIKGVLKLAGNDDGIKNS